MNPYTLSVLSCILLFFGMVSFTALGHRAGRRRLRSKSVDEEFTTAVVDAAIMSLLGLLIAFTFSKAYSRYEKRRDLIVQEVNEIGTAYMRLQLLPAERQASLARNFTTTLHRAIKPGCFWTIAQRHSGNMRNR